MLIKRIALYNTISNFLASNRHNLKLINPYNFSTNKTQQQPNSQESPEQAKTRREAARRQKLKQIQKQQIKAMYDRVELTRGNYSPFIEYIKLHKPMMIGLGVLAIVGIFGWKIWAMSGVLNVEELEKRFKQVDGVTIYQYQYLGIKKQKKFSIVSSKYQQQHLGQPIYKLFSDIYSTLPKQQITPVMCSKLVNLQKKLSQYFQTPITITPISTEQPITLALPNKNILVSKSLIRSGKFSQFQLQFLLILNQQLFKQGYHLRTLALSQIPTFWSIKSGASQIKLRQIYARKYKRNQILNTIDLVKYKLGIMQNPQQNLQIQNLFQNLKILNQQLNKGKETTCEQNIYQRLYKYYIFVKIQ